MTRALLLALLLAFGCASAPSSVTRRVEGQPRHDITVEIEGRAVLVRASWDSVSVTGAGVVGWTAGVPDTVRP